MASNTLATAGQVSRRTVSMPLASKAGREGGGGSPRGTPPQASGGRAVCASPAYRFLARSAHPSYTFSSFRATGGGLAAVTAAAMAAAASQAAAGERPGKEMKRESVSPYTTRAGAQGAPGASTIPIAASSVARPLWTMASASSAQGMRPEKPAAV